MIKIYDVVDGGKYQITVIGHAKDEKVCAGVSALYVALAETAGKEGALADHTEGTDAKRAYIWRTKTIKPYISMFRQGVRAIAREYPEDVMIET